jgi:hypothetical protein
VDAGGVKSAGLGIDIVLNGVGAQDVGGEGIELRRRVSKEVSESDGREWVRIGVVCRVSENHCRGWEQILLDREKRIEDKPQR